MLGAFDDKRRGANDVSANDISANDVICLDKWDEREWKAVIVT
jgi:hypothetical protein